MLVTDNYLSPAKLRATAAIFPRTSVRNHLKRGWEGWGGGVWTGAGERHHHLPTPRHLRLAFLFMERDNPLVSF